eukprot:3546176-Rhodomonas_salina.1
MRRVSVPSLRVRTLPIQIRATAFLVQLVPGLRWRVFDFAVCGFHRFEPGIQNSSRDFKISEGGRRTSLGGVRDHAGVRAFDFDVSCYVLQTRGTTLQYRTRYLLWTRGTWQYVVGSA